MGRGRLPPPSMKRKGKGDAVNTRTECPRRCQPISKGLFVQKQSFFFSFIYFVTGHRSRIIREALLKTRRETVPTESLKYRERRDPILDPLVGPGRRSLEGPSIPSCSHLFQEAFPMTSGDTESKGTGDPEKSQTQSRG